MMDDTNFIQFNSISATAFLILMQHCRPRATIDGATIDGACLY